MRGFCATFATKSGKENGRPSRPINNSKVDTNRLLSQSWQDDFYRPLTPIGTPLFTGSENATRVFILSPQQRPSPTLFTGIKKDTREQSGGRMCICGVCCALHNHSSPVSGEEFVRAERSVNFRFSIFNNNTCAPSVKRWGAGVILCVWFYFLPRFSQCSVSHWRTGRS